jgi:signal transduction histidine kinase
LRTPLNAASLGLKLLTDEIETSSDPKDIDRYSTLCDVNLACRTAVDILNDLLCFDKIESGVLEVHKHEVSLLPFIKDCVGMFSAQAREGGVKLSIVSCIDEEHHIHHKELPLHSPLRESDTVSMDKFKMDQVLKFLRLANSRSNTKATSSKTP